MSGALLVQGCDDVKKIYICGKIDIPTTQIDSEEELRINSISESDINVDNSSIQRNTEVSFKIKNISNVAINVFNFSIHGNLDFLDSQQEEIGSLEPDETREVEFQIEAGSVQSSKNFWIDVNYRYGENNLEVETWESCYSEVSIDCSNLAELAKVSGCGPKNEFCKDT